MAFTNGISSPPTLSVVIVTYNSENHVGTALRALEKAATATNFEVIVVDNASVDASIATVRTECPDAIVIASPENLGFGVACNLAVRQARGEFLLFLNPDSEADPAAVDLAVEYLAKHHEAGIVGGRTRYPNGQLNPTCCSTEPTLWSAFCYATGLSSVFRRSRVFNPEALGSWDRDSDRAVDVITGCFALLRTSLFRSLGGFDERFFMYSEDTDLCRRVRDLGLQCVHLSEVGLVHIGGGSDNIRAVKWTKLLCARLQYYDKHWSPFSAKVGRLLIYAGVLARLAASTALGSVDRRTTWQSIWAARDSWHDGAQTTRRSDEIMHADEQSTSEMHTSIRPVVLIQSHPAKMRARIIYRLLRHIFRSTRSGDRDFVREGVASLARIPLLTIRELLGPDIRECNICGWTGRSFYPNTGPGYFEPATICPGCMCQDRHRSLLALLLATTTLFAPDTQVVEVAPMRGFESLLRSQPEIDYISFDLARHAMERGDITAMRFPADSVDYFICFHVLEHIPDEHRALAEIRRVLKPGGVAVLQVPVDWHVPATREYAAPDPRDVGHVRRHGADFPERIASAGFEVTSRSVLDVFDPATVARFGMSPEPIFFANCSSHDQLS
jgi:N-acetylglucosaminyl-diphospho-decaprenol L-rhamnosyltransferase